MAVQKPGYQEMKLMGDSESQTASEESTSCVAGYFEKWKGAGDAGPPKLPLEYSAWSFLGTMVGMGLIGALHSYVMEPMAGMALLVGAFGAMSVILFSAFKAPVAQPKNVIIGNTLGGFVGVAVFEAFKLAGHTDLVWLMAALAVSLTIVIQELTATVHPPGGATALIYVTMPPVQTMGWKFVFCPSFLGAAIMVAVACVTNNLGGGRSYPQYWWPGEDVPKPPLSQTWNSFLGSFTAIAILGYLNAKVVVPEFKEVILIGAFGAMSVIVFSAWKVPFAQPKNAIIGNTIGGFVGVSVYNLGVLAGVDKYVWLTAALSVAVTILVQELTNTVHPPGGATALLFDIIPLLHSKGYWYVFTPSFLGTVILVCIGLVTNNLVSARTYPQFWWPR